MLYDVYEDFYNIYMVLELCSGGEFYDYFGVQG